MSKRKRERKSARTESFLRSLCRRDASILNLFIVLLELIARLRVGRAGFEFTTRLVPVSRLSSPVTGLSRWLSSACTFAVARVYEVACRDAFLKRQETPSCRVFRGGQWSPPPSALSWLSFRETGDRSWPRGISSALSLSVIRHSVRSARADRKSRSRKFSIP